MARVRVRIRARVRVRVRVGRLPKALQEVHCIPQREIQGLGSRVRIRARIRGVGLMSTIGFGFRSGLG